MDTHLTVIMPVYNEEDNLKGVIEDHLSLLKNLTEKKKILSWDILCLDDASTDNSPRLLEEMASREGGRVTILSHAQNRGIYNTYQRLFREARGPLIYQTASDGQWPAENLEMMLDRLLETRADLVIGVRANRRKVYSLWRQILSHGFNLFPRVLFGTETRDANSIKLGKKEIFVRELQSKSYFMEIERIIRARRSGKRIEFAEIEFLPRTGGKASGAKMIYIMTTLADLVKFCFNDKANEK